VSGRGAREPPERRSAVIPETLAGQRFDRALAALFPDYSRARIQRWIRAGDARVDARRVAPKERARGGERVELTARLAREQPWRGQALPLEVVHEDEHLLVVAKPAGLVVHPGAGNPDGTLVNALLHHAPELESVPRAGIVHRLDKGTSGLLAVARTLPAHRALVAALKARELRREYEAVVVGRLAAGGRVDAPIARHARARTRMAVRSGGRPAATEYRVARRFRAHTHLRLRLESGRTHQIRVHMAHLGHPVVGDPAYAGRGRIPAGATPALAAAIRRLAALGRQALHARRLGLAHPVSGRPLVLEAALPADLAALLAALAEDAGAGEA